MSSLDLKNNQKNRDHPAVLSKWKTVNQWYFGERLHAGVDAGTGYIHSMEVTAANGNERDVVPALIREDDEVVYGDAGYTDIEKREEIKADQHLSSIQYRMDSQKPYRKNKWKNDPGVWWFRYMEYQKSRMRSKVEYVFFVIKRIFGYRKVRYRGLAKNRTQAHMLCASANLYMLAQTKRRRDFWVHIMPSFLP